MSAPLHVQVAAHLFERAAIGIGHARHAPAVAADANAAASLRKEGRRALGRQEGLLRHVLAAWQQGLSSDNFDTLEPRELRQPLLNRLGLALQAGCGERGDLVKCAEVEGDIKFRHVPIGRQILELYLLQGSRL